MSARSYIAFGEHGHGLGATNQPSKLEIFSKELARRDLATPPRKSRTAPSRLLTLKKAISRWTKFAGWVERGETRRPCPKKRRWSLLNPFYALLRAEHGLAPKLQNR